MYLATKGGSSCRIPKRKAGYYKSTFPALLRGKSKASWMKKSERAQVLQKKRRPVKKNQLRKRT